MDVLEEKTIQNKPNFRPSHDLSMDTPTHYTIELIRAVLSD